ncbi:conserved protein of unknown function [Candidatus Filomicrobium marinum]|uniref:Tail protein n=2 Tax=Filomicrobium TaxID=119044 RepID=A0A0D6JJ82_9HYPH|nr:MULTISPECIES: phage tail tape measure protein [Filomicrobium]MCV0370826.1 phage tail tape measure protein [Filomicrobium sp.]CFX31521.1 conserved protein of unknown function [Candidatus Filomicrobium marinum]CPR22018.1 conserved protein of unknown function [Candidatus Filomicrobium marinum]SDP45898.1 hypothetical protein SAMN04488061_3063 [Filomicrobium insigne]
MGDFDEGLETWTVVVDADTRALRQELDVASTLGRRFSNSLVKAFEGIAVKGRSLGEVLRGLTADLSGIVLKAAFKPLEQGFGSLVSGLFAGGLGVARGAPTPLPVPFAKGGVVQSPFTFPVKGGVGLAGEAGAEAIMPLARGRDGRLGVVAQGDRAGINVVVNVTTPNAESFQRAQTQVAAAMARAISMGQRNL